LATAGPSCGAAKAKAKAKAKCKAKAKAASQAGVAEAGPKTADELKTEMGHHLSFHSLHDSILFIPILHYIYIVGTSGS